MPSVGFEPGILAIKRLQTYALDRMATGIGSRRYLNTMIMIVCQLHSASNARRYNIQTI